MPREYVAGRPLNLCGPKRRTIAEPDWAAVERALRGDRSLVLSAVERSEAIARLDRLGLSSREIGIRLGMSQRTVVRWRAEHRGQAVPA